MLDIYVHFFNNDTLPRGPFSYGDLPTRDCTGLTSVAVQWLKNFFTEQGSDPLNMSYGTAFARMLGRNIGTREEVQEFVQLAVIEATRQQIRLQSEDLSRPNAMRLSNAELTELTVGPTGVNLTVFLTNQNGESVNAGFQVPRG